MSQKRQDPDAAEAFAVRTPPRSLATALSLLRAGEFGELGRRLTGVALGRRLPLPASLRPLPRSGGARPPGPSRARPLVLAFAPSLRLEGAPISQCELIEGLTARGYDVVLVSPADGPLRARYAAFGCAVEIDPFLTVSSALPRDYEREVATIAARLRARAPDMIYVNTLDMFPVVDAARIAGIPSLWNIRETEPWRERLADRHTRIAARALACFSYPGAVAFVSQTGINTWGAFVPEGRAHLIPNALRTQPASGGGDWRAKIGADADDILFLSVGTVCARKGQADLLRALAALPPDAQARAFVALAGPMDEAYRAEFDAAARGAPPRWRWLGEIQDMAGLYGAADAYVSPSRSEAMPRTVLEAAATGLPVAATDTALSVLPPDAFLRFAPGDIAALAGHMDALVRDTALRGRMGEAARQARSRAASYDVMVDRYAALLDRCLS